MESEYIVLRHSGIPMDEQVRGWEGRWEHKGSNSKFWDYLNDKWIKHITTLEGKIIAELVPTDVWEDHPTYPSLIARVYQIKKVYSR